MPTYEERLASLEARMEAMSDLKDLIAELRGDMNGRFTELRTDINARFGAIDQRFTDMSQRLGDVNQRFGDVNHRLDEVNRRLAGLDEKGDRHFTWMVGTQVAILLAVVGAMLGAYYR